MLLYSESFHPYCIIGEFLRHPDILYRLYIMNHYKVWPLLTGSVKQLCTLHNLSLKTQEAQTIILTFYLTFLILFNYIDSIYDVQLLEETDLCMTTILFKTYLYVIFPTYLE